MPAPRFAAALSTHPVPATAVGEVVGQLLEAGAHGTDLLALFVNRRHTGALDDIVRTVRAIVEPVCLIGCTAVSVLANGNEAEDVPAIAALAAGVGPVMPLRIGDASAALPPIPPHVSAALLLADPFSGPPDEAVASLQRAVQGAPIVGGLASAANGPGGNRFVLDDAIYDDGAVAVLFGPSCTASTLVSQGCRPIGSAFTVTDAERNVVRALGGRPPLDRFNELVETLDEENRGLLRNGVHVGLVVDEHRLDFTRGDFLVRPVLGADRATGAIAIGDEVMVGTTMQFHVRDAASAHEDLGELLAGADSGADAAFVFTCNGRGKHLFGTPDHDASMIADALQAPIAGMFCAGEIGPIGGATYMHGFTASVLALRRVRDA